MSEEQPGKSEGPDQPEKKLSPLEQIRRAKAAAESSPEEGGESAGAGSAAEPEQEKKKLSPIEQMRAKAAAAKSEGSEAGGGESGKKLSPIEQMRAAKQAGGGKESAAAAEKKPAAKAEPPQAPAAKQKPKEIPKPKVPKVKPGAPAAKSAASRRTFVSWIGVAWTSFVAGCSAASLSAVRFMYPNVLKEPASLFKVGPPDQFTEGEVSIRWQADYGVWIARNEGRLYALRAVCTHLGCTPNWLEGEQKFKCPCHGSGFRKSGINFEGPAPRPLERYAIAIADDGQVQVDKSKILHEELGQWTIENGAFIDVS